MDFHQTGDKSLSKRMISKFTDAYMRHSASGMKVSIHIS